LPTAHRGDGSAETEAEDNMSVELAGKGALVTGAASGIGRATVIALPGAAVAALDRDQAPLNQVVEEGKKAGGKAFAIGFDLANTDRIENVVAEAIRHLGRIDILVNCAGITDKFQRLTEIEESGWDLVHTVNLKAPLFLMKHVARHMIETGGGGRIVNLSSSSAFRARNSPVAYASSKAAIVQLTRSAAAELGGHDINVNAVAPGITATAMTRVLGNAEALDKAASSGPLENLFHRVSQPEDVAAAILFLCLPGSRQITGQTIHTSAGAVI
jgi:NAD(P)-dependent dehydrogenase (short-subunit alcohol dehydrogenase family)